MIITGNKLIQRIEENPRSHWGIVLDESTITDIGPAPKIKKKYLNHSTLNLNNCLILPALLNIHTHLELPALLDTIRAATFSDWVINLIREKRNINNEIYTSSARSNIESLIRSGVSTVGEICTHQASPSLLKKSGLRAVIFDEIISMNPTTKVKMPPITRRSRLVGPGLSPHAPHTVSANALLQVKQFCARHKLSLCMHVAESKDEIMLLQGKKSGFEKLYEKAGWNLAWAPQANSPFEYLHSLGLLGPRFLAVHAVHATDRDIVLLKRTRTPIAHCPRSNKELGVGRMQLKKFLDAGISVGLGTDSLASSPSLNLWDEMRFAYKIHKKDGITAQDILTLATIGGAKALGMDKEIGSLEIGKRADIIAVPLPSKNTGDIYSDLLRETKSCIMSVVNGKILFRDRE